jgi:hypothetical protein
VIARIRAWLKRRRAWRCARGLHAWTEQRPVGHPRLVISRCEHCGATYRKFG